MTKKFSWEVEKTSLILRVADGPKTTEYKISKNTKAELTAEAFAELSVSLSDKRIVTSERQTLVTNPEVAPLDATSEEASMAALKAKADALSEHAQWWVHDEVASEDLIYDQVVQLPDYDEGEI